MICVWCGLHQINLVMQRVYKKALDDEFMGILTSLIGHLHRQHNLIQDMQSTCPNVATTIWVSMQSSSRWLTTNIIRVNKNLENKKPHCTPPKLWWTFLFVVHAFADEARHVFVGLQSLTTLLSEQCSRLAGLVNSYFRMYGMSVPRTANEIAAVDTTTAEVHDHYVLTHAKSKLFIEGLCMRVLTAIDELESNDLKSVLVSVAKLFVESSSGIMAILAERDSLNEKGTELTPVLRCQLVHLDM